MTDRTVIEEALEVVAGEIAERDIPALQDKITPKLNEWFREYNSVPYTLVDGWLSGFTAAAQIRRADLEEACNAAAKMGLSTGHADDFVQLVEELLVQISGLRDQLGLSEMQRKSLARHQQQTGNVVERAREIQRDRTKALKGGYLQLFCPQCGAGVGDEKDADGGFIEQCQKCHSDGPWLYAWETIPPGLVNRAKAVLELLPIPSAATDDQVRVMFNIVKDLAR